MRTMCCMLRALDHTLISSVALMPPEKVGTGDFYPESQVAATYALLLWS